MAAGTLPGTPPHRIHTAIFDNCIGTKGTTIGDRRGRLFGDGGRHVGSIISLSLWECGVRISFSFSFLPSKYRKHNICSRSCIVNLGSLGI